VLCKLFLLLFHTRSHLFLFFSTILLIFRGIGLRPIDPVYQLLRTIEQYLLNIWTPSHPTMHQRYPANYRLVQRDTKNQHLMLCCLVLEYQLEFRYRRAVLINIVLEENGGVGIKCEWAGYTCNCHMPSTKEFYHIVPTPGPYLFSLIFFSNIRCNVTTLDQC
jgi:hypothetical protein